MRNPILSLLLIIIFAPIAGAQKISHIYNNVSLSEALLQMQDEQEEYTVNFVYNELEDFLVSTTVHNKTLPEAIQQIIGFYPVRMTVKENDHDIYVECVHKTSRHLTGLIIDERGLPLPYVNVAVLSPADSTLIAGGVANESGYFAIPVEQQEVLMRISHIGYKSVCKTCDTDDAGTIQLQPETYTINGATVKGSRDIVQTENGRLVYNMPQLLQIMPADDAYEALTHIPGIVENDGNLNFMGRSATLIINGKPSTLSREQIIERLKSIPASQLAKAEVMPAAPAKYHVHGVAINVETKNYSGTNQLAAQVQGVWSQGKYATGQAKGSMLYNHGPLGISASYSLTTGKTFGRVGHNANQQLDNEQIAYHDLTRNKAKGTDHEYHLGIDYSIADNHRLSVDYTGQWNHSTPINTTTGVSNTIQRTREHTYLHNVDASYSTPFGLQLCASYTNYRNPRTQHLDGTMLSTERSLEVDSRQKISKWLFTADQTHQLHGGWSLSYGAKAQTSINDSYQTTLNENNQPIDYATSRVDYRERILDIYGGMGWQGKKFNIDASLSAEQYHATKWDKWRLYPTLNAMWNINSDHMLNLSFSSEAVYPSYWSTMSSIYYSSIYSEIWGNPDLKPMSHYEVMLMWQWKKKYTITAFTELQPDYFVQLAYQPTDRLAVVMKETNFNYSNLYGLQASAQFSAGRWLNGNGLITALYRHDKSNNFFDLPFNRTKLSFIFGGTTTVRLSQAHNITLSLTPFIQTKAIQGVYDIDPLFRLRASLRWTSDNGRWSVTLQGTNILKNNIYTHSRMGNQDYTMKIWAEPNVALSVVYRMGGFKEKPTKKVDTSRMGH